MKKNPLIIFFGALILLFIITLCFLYSPSPKVWQQIASEASSREYGDPEYALSFTVRFAGERFVGGDRPEGLSAAMIERDNPENRFLNDSPHRGGSRYIGMWSTGFNPDGDMIVTLRANPDYFRKIHRVPEENDVLVKVILSAEGFHDLELAHIFHGKNGDS